jgi:hypothetical protein
MNSLNELFLGINVVQATAVPIVFSQYKAKQKDDFTSQPKKHSGKPKEPNANTVSPYRFYKRIFGSYVVFA